VAPSLAGCPHVLPWNDIPRKCRCCTYDGLALTSSAPLREEPLWKEPLRKEPLCKEPFVEALRGMAACVESSPTPQASVPLISTSDSRKGSTASMAVMALAAPSPPVPVWLPLVSS
jgi:hypothetical protein